MSILFRGSGLLTGLVLADGLVLVSATHVTFPAIHEIDAFLVLLETGLVKPGRLSARFGMCWNPEVSARIKGLAWAVGYKSSTPRL